MACGVDMSLDVYLKVVRPTEIYNGNVTHNLVQMAREAGIYMPLWRPDEIGITTAKQLIQPLTDGLALLRSDPDRFKQLNPANGWGTYEGFCNFVAEYLLQCGENPEATVEVSR